MPTAAKHIALGIRGEQVAADYLAMTGMVILDKNWRCRRGEIDLVCREGDDLVACEVKTRSSHRHGTPHEAVTPAKLARLRDLVVLWAIEHNVTPVGYRIDVVAVTWSHNAPPHLEHVRGLL